MKGLKNSLQGCVRGVVMEAKKDAKLTEYNKNKKILTVDDRIKKEKRELTKLFKNIEPNKKKIIDRLIDRAAFLKVQMEDLEISIKENGWEEEYQNGANQKGVKRSASGDVYLQLIKNFTAINKQLTDMVPMAERKSKLAELVKM